MNVIRKSCQASWQEIFANFWKTFPARTFVTETRRTLRITDSEGMEQFIEKLAELIFSFYISDPPLKFYTETIGTTVSYLASQHDSFDGFIKAGEASFVILPSVTKVKETEVLVKACVLKTDYSL